MTDTTNTDDQYQDDEVEPAPEGDHDLPDAGEEPADGSGDGDSPGTE